MTRFLLLVLALVTACGDNLTPETPETPEVPEDAGPPDGPPPPNADGEYAIKVSPTAFFCDDGPRTLDVVHTLTDIIPQEDPWTFDLRSTLQGTFIEFDRYDLPWDVDGFFTNERDNDVSFGYFTVTAKRFIEGSATAGTLAFFHRYGLGWYEPDESFHAACTYEADIAGTRRYQPWDGTPRTSIDGQWRVKRTILASPLTYSAPLPYARYVTMDALTQSDNGNLFDLQGGYHRLFYVNRDPVTGAVDATAQEFVPTFIDGQNLTTLYETKLWGTLQPDAMDLEFSWRWSTVETGEESWYQHERYEGVPRYNPHDPALAETPEGAYNAEYVLLENDCGAAPYAMHHLLDVRPMDDGAVWPRITSFDLEPVTHLGPGGALHMTFTRYANGNVNAYTVDGTIDGHAANLTTTIDVTDAYGGTCTATYRVAGEKRYESYHTDL